MFSVLSDCHSVCPRGRWHVTMHLFKLVHLGPSWSWPPYPALSLHAPLLNSGPVSPDQFKLVHYETPCHVQTCSPGKVGSWSSTERPSLFLWFLKVECGKGYMAFTEYDQSTYTGIVAFKDATIIETRKNDKEKSNHLFLYEMFHGANPRPGSDLIITGMQAYFRLSFYWFGKDENNCISLIFVHRF